MYSLPRHVRRLLKFVISSCVSLFVFGRQVDFNRLKYSQRLVYFNSFHLDIIETRHLF